MSRVIRLPTRFVSQMFARFWRWVRTVPASRMPIAIATTVSFGTAEGSWASHPRYPGRGCDPTMLSTISLSGNGVTRVSGTAEREARNSNPMDDRYGCSSRTTRRPILGLAECAADPSRGLARSLAQGSPSRRRFWGGLF